MGVNSNAGLSQQLQLLLNLPLVNCEHEAFVEMAYSEGGGDRLQHRDNIRLSCLLVHCDRLVDRAQVPGRPTLRKGSPLNRRAP